MNLKRLWHLIKNLGKDYQGNSIHKTSYLVCVGCNTSLKTHNPYYHVGFCKECGQKHNLERNMVKSFITFLNPDKYLPPCNYCLNLVEPHQSQRTTKAVALKLIEKEDFPNLEPLIGHLDNSLYLYPLWMKRRNKLESSKALAGNPHTPISILDSIMAPYNFEYEGIHLEVSRAFKGYDGILLCHIAKNPSIDDKIFNTLLNERNISILYYLAHNPNTTPERARKILDTLATLNPQEGLLVQEYFKTREIASKIIYPNNNQ